MHCTTCEPAEDASGVVVCMFGLEAIARGYEYAIVKTSSVATFTLCAIRALQPCDDNVHSACWNRKAMAAFSDAT